MAHHVEPNGDTYVDTDFVNSAQRVSGVSLEHIGFGEFYFMTPKGRVEVDRIRGKDFSGQSGRSHKLYDDKHGTGAAEWLVEQAERLGKSERVARLFERQENLHAVFLAIDSELEQWVHDRGLTDVEEEAVGDVTRCLSQAGGRLERASRFGAVLADADAGLARWAGLSREATHSYVMSLAPDGAPEVDGFVDEVLFAMILAKVRGLQVGRVKPVNLKVVSVDGQRLTWKAALEQAVEEFSDQFAPLAGPNVYRVYVNVGSIYEADKVAGHAKAADSDWARMFPANSYLNRFFSEKEIPSKVFDIEDSSGVAHSIPNDVVVEAIAQARGSELRKIEDTIRQIDFRNGDVNHYFAHLATALAEQYAGALRFASPAKKEAGFDFRRDDMWFSFVGNKTPFNVDTIQEINQTWIPYIDDEGLERSVNLQFARSAYSGPLTYYQEKAGQEREVVFLVNFPDGTEADTEAAIRALGKNHRFKVKRLPKYREPQTQSRR